MGRIKKLFVFMLALTMAVPLFAGCGNKDKGPQDTQLTISYFLGGYKREWIETIAAKFEEETGYLVNLNPDANLLSSIESKLKDGTGSDDLFLSHDIQWERYAALGYLEPLDDLYSSEYWPAREADPETAGDKGDPGDPGVLFSDRVIDIGKKASKLNGKYYKVPYTQGCGGLVYNKKMFSDNGWTVPTTYSGLVSLCAEIVKSGKTPFVWGGKDQWLWDYVVFEWWAQMAGTDKIAELMKYESAETFNPSTNWKEMKQAYTAWYELIAKNKSYSLDGSNGLSKEQAQTAFLRGEAAMIPEGHWFYNETLAQAPAGFEMEMMNTPVMDDPAIGVAKQGYEKVNYMVGFGDSIIIPAKSRNKNVAKLFLKFLAREQNCQTFTQKTNGAVLGFDYDFEAAFPENTFSQSVKTKLTESISFNDYSSNQIAILLYETLMVWPQNDYYYQAAYNNPSTVNPNVVFDEIYNTCKRSWSNWSSQAGL